MGRTVLSVQNIIELLQFCLHNTYFLFKIISVNRLKVWLWGSPVSPIVANLYMEYFEQIALSTASTPLGIGLGLCMTLLSSNKGPHKQIFLDHINKIDPAIKFTVESNQENGTIPFLDTLVKPEADNSLSISV